MGIDERIERIGRHPFRARFRLRGRDRACLERWHELPKGRELDPDEQAYAVAVVCRWIERKFDGDA